MRCGTCMAVCPVYDAVRQEGSVARGKLGLIKAHVDGALADDKRYRFFLTACLLCNRCMTSCPNEVDTAAVVQAARARLARRGKLGRFKRFVLGRLLPSRRFLPALIAGARAARPLWAGRVPGDSGLQIRFLRGPDGQRRRLPPLAKPFYLKRDIPVAVGDGPRVAVFVGCINNYMRPQAAEASVELLATVGAAVDVPRHQCCCGMPAFGAGENRGARKLAARNVDAFMPVGKEPPAFITSPCASCAYMLKQHLPDLLADDPERSERAQLLAARVVPLSVLWARLSQTSAEGPGRAAPGDSGFQQRTPLTFHDPCHLSRGFGEKDAPRLLLTNLPGARIVEMSHPCRCCGHGGSFNLAHYDLSCQMGADKARRVVASEAQVVVTECSGCVLQLAETVAREGSSMEVMTTAEAALRFASGADPETQGD